MLERALKGNKAYWLWIIVLLAVIGVGVGTYVLKQLQIGLGVTGMGRDITWGFYIANFTYLVGVAASAVMLVIPYYLHDYKKFARVLILGEWLAVSSVLMCMMFIMADMGQPQRFMNLFLHPTPNSILFWDANVLLGYLILNLLIGWATLHAYKKDVAPPKWTKILIYISIPWAVSIHTVTAFLYAGLPGRHLWLTAIMAPRFLASAFASGPAILLIIIMIVRSVSKFKPDSEAIQSISKIVLYAMIVNIFFYLMEFFTAFYSGIPSHAHSLGYLFFGHGTAGKLVPFMWTAVALGISGVLLLLIPSLRRNEKVLTFAALLIFISTWIDKGMALVIGGFIPSPLESYTEYTITNPELAITLGVYAIGLLILTILYKVAVSITVEKEQM